MNQSKLLPVLGMVLVSIAVVVGSSGLPEWARGGAALRSEPREAALRDPRARVLAEPLPTLSGTPASPAGGAQRTSESRAASWLVEGHVRRGTYGSYPGAALVLRLFAGSEASGNALVEVRLRSDERGDFAWACPPPAAETLTVEVTPELEGHKVGAATRVVRPGDSPPVDLQPYVYWLDARVLGRVVDAEGAPIPAARVLSHLSEAVTGSDGRYSLPMDSTYPVPSVRVVADGFAEGAMAIGALRPGDVLAGDLVLRADFAVEGRVIDETGDPVPGAIVCTYPRERNQTSTDEEGRFRLGQLDPGKKRTRVSALLQGYVTASVRIGPEDAATPMELVLDRGSSVAGRVVTRDGRPVPGATVSVGHYPASSGPLSTRTDETGSFSVDVVPSGSQSVWALREGYAAGQAHVELPESGTQVDGLQILLEPGQRVAGVVLDEDGDPLRGAQIVPESAGSIRGMSAFVGPSTTSGEDGRFQLEALREDRVVLRVWAEGCSVLEQRVSAGSTNVILRPERAGRLAGRVVDGRTGKPVESFIVRFVAPEAPSSEPRLSSYGAEWSQSGLSFVGTDGYWTSGLEALQMGAVTGIEVSAPGYAVAQVGHAVVERDPAPDAILVELVSGTRLTGYVIDAATGATLSGARVRRFTEGDPADTQRYLPDPDCVAQTDANGRFTMERVPSGSMYLLADSTSLPLAIDGPFELPPGAGSIERTIEVGMGGRLTGKLLTGDGEGLADEKVILTALDLPYEVDRPRLETTTAADGAYSFDGLVPGPYHLSWALTRAGKTVGSDLLRLLQIEQGQTLEFDLQPLGEATLRGRIEFDGQLPEDIHVSLRPEQEPSLWAQRARGALVENGEFVATHLEPGPWTILVSCQVDGRMLLGQAQAELPRQGTVQVSLSLRAFGR